MDQPTARRRRHGRGANSVTVAELQAKNTPSQHPGVSAIQERDATAASAHTPSRGQLLVPETAENPDRLDSVPDRVLDRVPDSAAERAGEGADAGTDAVRTDNATDEPRSSDRLVRIIVGTLVAIAVCGVVSAAEALSGGRPHRLSPSVPAVRPVITGGPAAVRPDAMIEQLTSGALTRAPAEPTGTVDHQGYGILADRDAAEQVVLRFYEDLPLRTELAFGLLGPGMSDGNSWALFKEGWLGTRAVEAWVLAPNDEDNGLLRVKVSIERFDGSLLLIVQRIEVRVVPVDGAKPQLRIVGIQLLSAHRR